MSWVSHITDAGVALLRSMLGGAQLTVTRAEIGGGITADDEIPKLVSVADKIPATVSAVRTENAEAAVVEVRISNYGVTDRAVMHQVGLYAASGATGATGASGAEGDEEILFAVYQNEFGEEIPTYAEYPNLLLKFYAAIDVSATDNITVANDHNAFMTYDDMVNAIAGAVEISSSSVPAVGVRTHYYVIADVPGYTPQQYTPEGVEDGYIMDDEGNISAATVSDGESVSPMALNSN